MKLAGAILWRRLADDAIVADEVSARQVRR